MPSSKVCPPCCQSCPPKRCTWAAIRAYGELFLATPTARPCSLMRPVHTSPQSVHIAHAHAHPFFHSLVGGIVATLTQSLVMVPLEARQRSIPALLPLLTLPQVVRQRQQVQTVADRAAGGYRGSLHAASVIARVEGPRALYTGFGVTQAVWAPFNAIYLPLWEGTKRLGVRVTGVPSVR